MFTEKYKNEHFDREVWLHAYVSIFAYFKYRRSKRANDNRCSVVVWTVVVKSWYPRETYDKRADKPRDE